VEEMNFQGTCSASPFVVKFDSAKAGKIAWYWLRWVNRKGEAGPWSMEHGCECHDSGIIPLTLRTSPIG